MFTGIIQELGRVKSAAASGGNLRLAIEAALSSRLKIGDSVSINGACQTVVSGDKGHFMVEAVAETLSRTNLGELKSGEQINLELPMSLNALLHGHMVQGHVDCVGIIAEIKSRAGSTDFAITYPRVYDKYLIEKGSVAVDGISLTVVDVAPGRFVISIIPHTLDSTIMQFRKVGDKVNLEFDLVAKYLEKMIAPNRGNLTIDFLKEHGF